MISGQLALYRKYRPRTFADLVGQSSITGSLKNAVETDSVRHAYLFVGPRGSGKTSTARVLGKAVNCAAPAEGEPCLQCAVCTSAEQGRFMDLHEIDAASNRGVDDIRQLREQVGYTPALGRRKVYIIDEVHMLTKEASNAFLKTLEEPPSHVLFILATTEAHKVLPTIASRCQRHDFRRIGPEAALERLKHVIEAEGDLAVSEDAMRLMALRGDGSLRDMLGVLEQTLSHAGREIDRDDVIEALGLLRDEEVLALAGALLDQQVTPMVDRLLALHTAGTDPRLVLDQLSEVLRAVLLVRTGQRGSLEVIHPESYLETLDAMAERAEDRRLIHILQLFCELSQRVASASVPQVTLEAGLLHASLSTPFGVDLDQRLGILEASVTCLARDLESRRMGLLEQEGDESIAPTLADPPAAKGMPGASAPQPPSQPRPPVRRAAAAVAEESPVAPQEVPPAGEEPPAQETRTPRRPRSKRLARAAAALAAVAPAVEEGGPGRARASKGGGRRKKEAAPSTEEAPAAEALRDTAAPSTAPPVPPEAAAPEPAVSSGSEPSSTPSPGPSTPSPVEGPPPDLDEPESASPPEVEEAPFLEPPVPAVAGASEETRWAKVMALVKGENTVTHAYLREARVESGEDGPLRVVFPALFTFHREKMGEIGHLSVLRTAVHKVYGEGTDVVIDGDGGTGAAGRRPGVPVDERDHAWGEKRFTEDRNVSLLVETFEGKVLGWEGRDTEPGEPRDR